MWTSRQRGLASLQVMRNKNELLSLKEVSVVWGFWLHRLSVSWPSFLPSPMQFVSPGLNSTRLVGGICTHWASVFGDATTKLEESSHNETYTASRFVQSINQSLFVQFCTIPYDTMPYRHTIPYGTVPVLHRSLKNPYYTVYRTIAYRMALRQRSCCAMPCHASPYMTYTVW